jgi:hypothetical protein
VNGGGELRRLTDKSGMMLAQLREPIEDGQS